MWIEQGIAVSAGLLGLCVILAIFMKLVKSGGGT